MNELQVDVCVIGAGSGGLSVAAGAVQMGASVVLVEGHKMGGDCLNYGCVPSKALLSAARRGLSYPDAVSHVAAAIAAIEPHDSQDRFEGLGCTVIRDWAHFVSPDVIEAGGQRIRARRFVVATGASAAVPPINGLTDGPFLTNETLFGLPELPAHLVILGAGPIGVEMAFAFRQLGSAVTLIDAGAALSREDPEAAALVLTNLRNSGVTLQEKTAVRHVGYNAGVIVQTSDGTVQGSHLLVATGRKPNLSRLGLDAAGVAYDDKGVVVEAGLRSKTNKRVYAIGDVAGGPQFTHAAGYHAGVIIRSMLFGLPAKARVDHIPRVTYGSPELAQIGLTEAEAKSQHGLQVEVMRADFETNDRAVTGGGASGFVKVMAVKGRPVGVTIVGPAAGELIGLWALVFANKLKLSAVAATVLPYPTLGEINKRATSAYFSPRLFESPLVKRIVGLVQRWLP